MGFLSDSGHVRAVMHAGIAKYRFQLMSLAGKRSRPSWSMRNPQFYVSEEGPVAGNRVMHTYRCKILIRHWTCYMSRKVFFKFHEERCTQVLIFHCREITMLQLTSFVFHRKAFSRWGYNEIVFVSAYPTTPFETVDNMPRYVVGLLMTYDCYSGKPSEVPEMDMIGSICNHDKLETISALLALCERNSPVTSEFPWQRPVARSFDGFFVLRLNKRLSNHSSRWWVETPSHLLLCYGNEIV